MRKIHHIEEIDFQDDMMIIQIDGKKHRFRIDEISRRLAAASRIEREKYEISPSGYGIHWPLIDEDLAIDGLLGIRHTPSKLRDKVSA
ncbi:MAG: DUF2442 domain-containing protein [Nitrospirae bacterium]|nr:DUF2442 domain-containing protein [Nitrospirota bacterium]